MKFFPIFLLILLAAACDRDESSDPNGGVPLVHALPTYSVSVDEEIVYAEGLAHDNTSAFPFAIPLKLDAYYPNNDAVRRPVFMFIHGGGFKGGTKTKPEIVAMAEYFASRGWVFVSIDYRTTEELGSISMLEPQEMLTYFNGIAPQEWQDYAFENASSLDEVQVSIAMYAAQRDAKAALRWMSANADRYQIDPAFITVGGASAGAVSAVALGISEPEDFKNEISTAADPTLATTNPTELYEVNSLVYFWGSNVKLELFEAIYGLERYDAGDPELFLAHGTLDANPTTTFSEATELNNIYDSIGIYSELVPLEGAGHGAWSATVNEKSLFELTFDFLIERQELRVD